jgi:hypothetical protein
VLHRGPHPSHVPMCDHWRTPEHVIYSIARYAHLLQGDDLTELDALKKIDEVLCLRVLAKKDRQAVTVEQYLGLVLAAHYPDWRPWLWRGSRLNGFFRPVSVVAFRLGTGCNQK